MDIRLLAYRLGDLVATIREIDGRLFIDTSNLGEAGIGAKIAEYASPREAQSWMNLILIEHFIDEVVGSDWEFSDSGVVELLAVYEKAWTYQIKASYPAAVFRIDRIIIEEFNDLG